VSDSDWTLGDGGFAKLYGDKIARSSLMDASIFARWLFVYLLACADSKGRYSCQTIETLARAANLTPEQTAKAVKELESPDPHSASPEYEGRRISRVNGGWEILNYTKYRDYRTKRQIKDVERKRARKEQGHE
jgi:hypothetical protein